MNFSSTQPYKGNLQIRNADGHLLIKAVGDIPHALLLNHLFRTPCLAFSLISAKQLVNNNCNISFSRSGCGVQDQSRRK